MQQEQFPCIGEPLLSVSIFNIDGIIELTDDFDLNTLTPELYKEKFEAVQDNFERVISLKMADDELYENIQTYC